MRSAHPTEVKASARVPRTDHSSKPPLRHGTADLFPATILQHPVPIFPKPNSVKASALMALIAGPARQSVFIQSWRLAAYIGFLREDGWAILSREVIENGRTVAEYMLDRSDDATRLAASRYRETARCAS